MTRDQVLKVASALFLVKVIGHEHILATKFPSLGTWRKAKCRFWDVQRGPGSTIGAPMGSHGGQRGTSRWFMWAQGRPLEHPGEPREAHPAAKGRQRGAKGRHGTTKTGQRPKVGQGKQKWPVKSTQAAPKWVQNGPFHGQNTKCKNIKNTLFFPFQMDWEPARNMPKMVPKGPWQTQWRDREHKWQAR